jgi:EAL domain-containing protein (putative c-di-GMP-specific phosphodiesterase class I)/GGDEF domain-containing protein
VFHRLRTKLTILYAGLFCAVLLVISAAAYVVAANGAQAQIRSQLQATGAVFDRLWQVRFQHLQEGADLSVRDYGFREAVATRDAATIRSALQNLRRRLNADLVFLVTPDGEVYGDEAGRAAPFSAALESALQSDDRLSGVLNADHILHQAVTAPILAPNLLGWVVVGQRLDRAEMRRLEQLSAVPLQAVALARGPHLWNASEDSLDPQDSRRVSAFIDRALRARAPAPATIDMGGGKAVALVRRLRALDGEESVLLLRYPLAPAMASYRALFGALIAIGGGGLALLVIGTWLLARDITRPISSLETAARRLEAGAYEPVEIRTRDEIAHLAASFNAMAAAIQQRERDITDLALTDSETGLPNRLALAQRLARERPAQPGFVAAIGVDRFSQVRGAIGYAHSNALIAHIGQRLHALTGRAPMGRLSSDVLGLAFTALDEGHARRRMSALQAKLEQPISLEGHVIDVDLTIGVAPAAADANAIDQASIALDQARAARTKLAFFDADAYGEPARNLSLMGEMRRALRKGEIHLAHQPKLDLRARRIVGVEALVRWRHPNRGFIAPDLFVPMSEETGAIAELTDWVLRRAVAEQAQMREAGWPLQMSVNISGRLLSDRHFARRALDAVGTAASEFCFEITETAVIDNPKLALENIELFAANGVNISIDDYGSGLSSLAYLKQLPAHELKIDKLFVQRLNDSQRDLWLVRSTVDLAHGLGLKVTAEGVEQPACLALLAAIGCDLAQGYLISRALPLNELLTMLRDDQRIDSLGAVAPRSGEVAA